MKVKLLLLFFLGLSMLLFSQVTVIMSADWQINNALTGGCYAGCYNPATNHFLVSVAGTTIKIFSGTDGSDTGNTLNLTGVDTGGLGIFALGATADGVIYGYSDGPSNLYRWANESATGTSAMTGVNFERTMDVSGTGASTKIALCGSDVSTPIDILGTADGLTFTLIDQTLGMAKNGCAVNATLDKAWAAPDTQSDPTHAIKTGGVWALESTIWLPPAEATGSTIMDYDDVADVLVACNPALTPRTIVALDGTTGALMASVNDTTVAMNDINCYGGVYIDKTGGKVFYTQRGVGNAVNMGRLSYSAALPAKAQDWSVYE